MAQLVGAMGEDTIHLEEGPWKEKWVPLSSKRGGKKLKTIVKW